MTECGYLICNQSKVSKHHFAKLCLVIILVMQNVLINFVSLLFCPFTVFCLWNSIRHPEIKGSQAYFINPKESVSRSSTHTILLRNITSTFNILILFYSHHSYNIVKLWQNSVATLSLSAVCFFMSLKLHVAEFVIWIKQEHLIHETGIAITSLQCALNKFICCTVLFSFQSFIAQQQFALWLLYFFNAVVTTSISQKKKDFLKSWNYPRTIRNAKQQWPQ